MTTTTQHQAGTFCWTQIGTTDPEGAKRFYSGLFGWKFDRQPLPNMDQFNLITRNGQPIGALYPMPKEQGAPSWLPFVAVDDCDQIVQRVKQNGGTSEHEPTDAMQDGQKNGRFAVLEDPTRAVFAIWQAGSKPGAGVINEPGAVCWNELITDDAKKAGDFYRKVFDWTPEQTPNPQGGTYTIFKKGSTQCAGMLQATPEMKLTHPYWMVYFGVDDVGKTANQARQLGGQIKMPATDIPDIGKFAVLTDPQGAYFSIFKPSNW